MTTFNDKLKSICNYSEKNQSMGPNVQLMYMDMIVEDDETKREVRRKKRNLTIDTILDEVDEENGDYTSETILTSEEGLMTTISPKIMTLNANTNPFVDDESLYNNVITFLENNTKQKHHYPISLDYMAMNDPHSTLEENNALNFRRIVTKIAHASNFIATEGRIGPATSVIVGRNNWHWFNEDRIGSNMMLGNISIVFEEKISSNKIIVARGGRIDQSGIMCVKSLTDNTYCLKETPHWEKQYLWFTIK
jgi:hypothetical protein